jgi:hypothetical protein
MGFGSLDILDTFDSLIQICVVKDDIEQLPLSSSVNFLSQKE